MIRRRHMLATSAAALTAPLAAPAFVERANAQSAFDWKQFKGQSIEVNYQLSPRGDLVRAHAKDFEELTGIKLGFEQIPEQQQRPKVAMEMATGHPGFDVAAQPLLPPLRRIAGEEPRRLQASRHVRQF